MLSALFLIKQGKCCGNGCLMCPYTKKHSGKSDVISDDVLKSLEQWEIEDIEKFNIEAQNKKNA